MALSEKDVRGIAEYAKIALTDDELTEMTAYMNNAVNILEPINTTCPTWSPRSILLEVCPT